MDLVLSPAEIVKKSAVFGTDRRTRRELRRWWDEPTKWAAWMMLNPSDAGADKDDPTMLRVIDFTRSWGFTGCVVCNAYPFISSDPREAFLLANWQVYNGFAERDAMHLNLCDIESIGRSAMLRVVAFGAEIGRRDQPWLEQCLERFMQPSNEPNACSGLWCLGVNSEGWPLHPLARGKMRVPSGTSAKPWTRP